jgi:hypothetical protein
MKRNLPMPPVRDLATGYSPEYARAQHRRYLQNTKSHLLFAH